MELRHLRYFIAVAEELHFGRAAKRLFLSQPALSRQIRQLEEEVGTGLLSRSKREVRLTGAGASFLQHGREILGRLDRAWSEARRIGRGDAGTLEIGYAGALGARVVPLIVRAFRKKHPLVEVRLRLLVPPNHLALLHTSQIDFALTDVPPPLKDLVVDSLLEEPFVLAAPTGHPLAKSGPATLRMLDGVPYVFFPRHIAPELHDRITDSFRKAGVQPNVVLETYPGYSIMSAVAAGIGVTLVVESMTAYRQEGIVFRRIKGICPTLEWALVYHPRDLLGTKRAFLDVVRKMYPVRSR